MTTAAGNEYGLNDTPPLLTNLFLGFQHTVMLTAMFLFPILIMSAAHGSMLGELRMIQACLFTMGLGTFLLMLSSRFIGAGYLASPVNDPACFPLSMMAVKIGGLPLLYTVNYIQAILQILCSELLVKFRRYFPIEITGLVILMIGISIISNGIADAVGGYARIEDVHWDSTSVAISFSSLLIMVAVTVWGKRFAKYGLLIGILWGLGLAYVLHSFIIPANTLKSLDIFSIPKLVFFTPQLIHGDLIIPLLVAVIAISLKAMGGLITLHKITNPQWTKPDLVNIRKGLYTTGIISLLAASLGGLPMGISSINIGLEITTQCFSRVIAWSIAVIMIVMSLFPRVCEIFILLPKPVMGAMVIFVISSLIITGIQIMLTPTMTSRRLFVIGLPIIIGLTFSFMPQLQRNMSPALQMLVSSPLTSATILALILNGLFIIQDKDKDKEN